MKLETGLKKHQLKDKINQSNIENEKKELLFFILNSDSNFFNFSFGLSFDENDLSSVYMDYMYCELKTNFIAALLNSEWDFALGDFTLEEDVLMVCISFRYDENIDDFLFNGKLKEDNRIEFNQLEIYLSNYDKKQAIEQGLYKVLGDSTKSL